MCFGCFPWYINHSYLLFLTFQSNLHSLPVSSAQRHQFAPGNIYGYEEPSPATVDDFLQVLAESNIRQGNIPEALPQSLLGWNIFLQEDSQKDRLYRKVRLVILYGANGQRRVRSHNQWVFSLMDLEACWVDIFSLEVVGQVFPTLSLFGAASDPLQSEGLWASTSWQRYRCRLWGNQRVEIFTKSVASTSLQRIEAMIERIWKCFWLCWMCFMPHSQLSTVHLPSHPGGQLAKLGVAAQMKRRSYQQLNLGSKVFQSLGRKWQAALLVLWIAIDGNPPAW